MDHCMIIVCHVSCFQIVSNAFDSWQVITMSPCARLVPKTATAALMPPTKGALLELDHVGSCVL